MNTSHRSVVIRPWLRCGLLPLVLAAAVSPLQAFKKDALNIYVRSVVDDAALERGLQPPDATHPQIYLLAPVKELPSAEKLPRPVDPQVVEKASRDILEKKGYVPAMEGDHPDMVITVSYGRGYLTNPYLQGPGYGGTIYSDVPGNDGVIPEVPDYAGTAHVTGASVQSIHFPTVDNFGAEAAMDEAKRQLANFEKLVIIVCAFDFQAMLKHKAKRLWRTAMYIDDPAHRDLNQITQQLLEAGADYFGRVSKGKEVEVTKPLPEGYVEIGRSTVVEQPAVERK